MKLERRSISSLWGRTRFTRQRSEPMSCSNICARDNGMQGIRSWPARHQSHWLRRGNGWTRRSMPLCRPVSLRLFAIFLRIFTLCNLPTYPCLDNYQPSSRISRPQTPVMLLGQGRMDPFQTLAKPATFRDNLCIDHCMWRTTISMVYIITSY
jgi:hypothetical protein